MQELNDTANKVLDVAERYTQTQGFNAFSYKDIQKEVGIKTSSIHYYFPTKHDLALSMTERYRARFALLLDDIAQQDETGVERLESLISVYVDALSDDKFCLCGMLASDILGLPESVREQLNGFFSLTETWITEAISLAKRQGDIKPAVVESIAAAHFLAALEGGMLIARLQKQPDYLRSVMIEALNQLKT